MTKRYYVTGNYSKYVKVGSKRIEALTDDKDVLVTAFKNISETVLIFTNKSEEEKPLSLPEGKEYIIAVTDKDNDLKESSTSSPEICLNPKSVTTVVIK
jgi:hypothetical protein